MAIARCFIGDSSRCDGLLFRWEFPPVGKESCRKFGVANGLTSYDERTTFARENPASCRPARVTAALKCEDAISVETVETADRSHATATPGSARPFSISPHSASEPDMTTSAARQVTE